MAGAVLVLVILALPAYGLWRDRVAVPGTVVSRIAGEEITLGYLLKWTQAELRAARLRGDTSFNPSSAPYALLDQLETAELVRRGAAELGIAVSEDELDQAMRQRAPVGTTGDEEPPTDEEVQQAYLQYLQEIGLDDEDMRSVVEADLLRQKITERLGEDISPEQEHVHVYAIPAQSAEERDEVLNRLEQGEDFLALAQEYIDRGERDQTTPEPTPEATPEATPEPTPEATAEPTPGATPEPEDQPGEDTTPNPADVGWIARGLYPSVEDALFALEVGEYTTLGDGNTIYYVAERDASRPLDDVSLALLRQRAFQDWLDGQRAQTRVERCFGQTTVGGGQQDCAWQYQWLVDRLS